MLYSSLYVHVHQAELYKEDFENERKDREKAHDLKEEMRFACDEKVHAMAKERRVFEESIQNLTRKLEGMSNEKEDLQKKREMRATRTSTRQHELQQNDKQIHELQEQLYEARQKAITAQEEVQAKTAQVKQYKKKDDQREEKVIDIPNVPQGVIHVHTCSYIHVPTSVEILAFLLLCLGAHAQARYTVVCLCV